MKKNKHSGGMSTKKIMMQKMMQKESMKKGKKK
jgi:hypothetical protein